MLKVTKTEVANPRLSEMCREGRLSAVVTLKKSPGGRVGTWTPFPRKILLPGHLHLSYLVADISVITNLLSTREHGPGGAMWRVGA